MVKVTRQALAQEGPIWFTPPPDKRGRYPHGLWGGGAKAPAAPDPYATANAQSQANIAAAEKQAELNRTNSQTPFGSNTWSQGADGRWTQTTTLDPKVQSMLDQFYSANQTAPASVNLSSNPALGQSLQSMQEGISKSVQSIMSSPTGIADNAGDIARTRGLASGAGDVLSQLMAQAKDTYGQKLDYSSLGALPQANEEMRQKVADALYANSARTLDPYWKQQQSDLASSLAAQGIQLGTDAYDRATGNQARDLNDAYALARNNATTMSTDQMEKLFSMEMARRQQGVGEANYLYNLPMELMGKGQGVYSGLETTLNQDYATNIAQRQADQALKSAQIADTLGTFGQLADTRGQAANEILAEHGSAMNDRNQLLNQLTALASGSQVANNAPVQVGASPVAESIYNSYNGQVAAANAANQARSGMISGLGQLGMAAASMYAMSDRRVKKNIERIGTHPLGIGLYRFDYLPGYGGTGQTGVMADEVEVVMPEAVITLPSGYKMVDYSKLEAAHA